MASLNSAGTSEVSEASAAEEPSAAGVMAAATTEPDVAAAEKEVVVGTIAIPDDESGIMKGGAGAKAADFANYFCSYAYLYHQKQMLTDHHRMQSYHSAVMKNKELFKGATVVDVGTGSGILAVWSAQAGAEKVWAVEFTDMAKHARSLVRNNGVDETVSVVKGAIEELDLPEKSVDIIISEWMGYFLLRESMLDSLLRGRDRLLKPGGCMFPSQTTMLFGLVSCEEERVNKIQDLDHSMGDWDAFAGETAKLYGVDMSCLSEPFEKEQRDYYLMSSCWCELRGDQVVGQPAAVKHLDLHTCTIADAQGVEAAPFSFSTDEPVTVSGFAGWFDADFAGSEENPCTETVVLSTAPKVGYTHWGQQVFFLEDPIELDPGDTVSGTMDMVRQKDSERLYDVIVKFRVRRREGGPSPMVTIKYEMP